jgi:hypothetical protein
VADTITLDDFSYPAGSVWIDRWERKPIVGRHETLLQGRALFETAEVVTGLPITIGTQPFFGLANHYCGLFTYDESLAIKTLYDEPDAIRTLVIGDESFPVRFDRSNNQGIVIVELAPVAAWSYWPDRIYSVTTRFRTTDPI